jgi:HNH endonuclease/NUMOD4 motif
METWLPIPGYEGKYEVSDAGHIRNQRGYVLKPGNSGGRYGYPMVILSPRKKHYVHELVALAFVGPRPDGQVVRHLDGDRFNNVAPNLAYGTSSQNSYDTVDHGHHFHAGRTHCGNGHEYTAENSYWNGRQRVCRPCRADRVAEWNERNPEYQAASKRSRRQRRGQARANLTHCSNGHEYTPENTIQTKGGTRRCRECKNANARKLRATP